MKTYELGIYKAKNSKVATTKIYFPELWKAQQYADTNLLRYYHIREFDERMNGIISFAYGNYSLKSF